MNEQNNVNEAVKAETAVEEGLENVIKFKRPIEFEGEKYESITLDFESLTGEDIEKAEVQFNAQNPQNAAVTVSKEMSKSFLSIVAAKAAGVNVGMLRKLSAHDYTKVTARTMVFLVRGE